MSDKPFEIPSANQVPDHLYEAGRVQVSGQATVDDAVAALRDLVKVQDGVAFRVTAVGGDNKLFGHAVFYKERPVEMPEV